MPLPPCRSRRSQFASYSAGILLAFCFSVYAQDEAEQIDWLSAEQMTQEQRELLDWSCNSGYVAPVDDHPEAPLPPEQAPLRATADRAEMPDASRVLMHGNVEVRNGSQTVSADHVEVNRDTGVAEVSGDVILRDPAIRVISSGGKVNNQSGSAELRDINLVIYDNQMRSQAQRFKRHGNNTVHLGDSSLTTCPPDNEVWRIEAESIDIRENNIWGLARNPVFKVKDIPVLWLPFFTFPASDERLSGFLFPGIGVSDNGGLDVAAPYYFNLSPNYDLVLSPRHINDRGSMLEGQFRHLHKRFETDIQFAGLSNDKGIDDRTTQRLVNAGIIEEGEEDPFINQDRWLLGVYQNGGAATGTEDDWYTQIDFTRVSDINYFRDLNNTAIDIGSETHLLRQATAGYLTENWNYRLQATSYQTLTYFDIEPYHELPRINVNGSYFWGPLQGYLNHEAVRFDQDEFNIRDQSQIIGDRAKLDYDLILPLEKIWGYVTPGVHLKHVAFQLDDFNLIETAETRQDYSTAQGSLDMGLFFEREGNLFATDYVQTFEPRAFYFYSDFTDQSRLFDLTEDRRDVDFDTADLTFDYNQLFRTTRFNGGDRLDDDNRLSIGLTTRFVRMDTGEEVFSASIGQIYYFTDRRVSVSSQTPLEQNKSEIAGQISASLTSRFTLNMDLVYDEETQWMSQGRANLQYLDDKHRLFNLGYSFRRQGTVTVNDELLSRDTRQSDISTIFPVTDKLNLIARNVYDFTFNRELDTFGGLEWNSCCYRARLLWRRWVSNDLSQVVPDDELDYRSGVFFDIQFKGFGSSQGRFYTLMNENIPNYAQRERAIYPE